MDWPSTGEASFRSTAEDEVETNTWRLHQNLSVAPQIKKVAPNGTRQGDDRVMERIENLLEGFI